MNLKIFTDGGARGNPGPAALGVVIYNEDEKIIATYKRYLGEKTNNQAEYEAVVMALEKAAELQASAVRIFLDSELIVKQLSGQYKVKNHRIIPMVKKILTQTNKFKQISFHHIPREQNQLADKLVNEAIDEEQKKSS